MSKSIKFETPEVPQKVLTALKELTFLVKGHNVVNYPIHFYIDSGTYRVFKSHIPTDTRAKMVEKLRESLGQRVPVFL